ncbi:hypothetical protein WSM22_13500 [Cytophagales bacterium WSM2-2]|nr:hypothetical protein WSM22_13500 [Cytophagales bacterium WSM2-2]
MESGLKTHILNHIRKIFANPWGEFWLIKLVRGRYALDPIAKLVPMPHLFPKPSWRLAERGGIKLRLDISDMVDWYAYFELKDSALEFILARIKKDFTVIDIGTNIGYVALRCAKIAREGKVYGFEPSEYNFSKCQANIALNDFRNLEVSKIALGSQESVLKLETVSPHNRGMNRVTDSSAGETETISVTTLDQKVKDLKLTKVDFIKMDVEGYEMHVLEGATNIVSSFRPIIFLEVNDTLLGNFGSSSNTLYHWLKNHGYAIYGIDKKKITSPDEIANKHLDLLAWPVESGSIM